MQVSHVAFEREKFCDHFDIDSMVLIFRSSIVTARKRKLRELYAVATESDGIPSYDTTSLDAKPPNAAETQFLFQTDIL